MPEQLLLQRARRAPARGERARRRPRGTASGRRIRARPRRARPSRACAAAVCVCIGSPPCEAQASASSSSLEAEPVGRAALDQRQRLQHLDRGARKDRALDVADRGEHGAVGVETASAPRCADSTARPRITSTRIGFMGSYPGVPRHCSAALRHAIPRCRASRCMTAEPPSTGRSPASTSPAAPTRRKPITVALGRVARRCVVRSSASMRTSTSTASQRGCARPGPGSAPSTSRSACRANWSTRSAGRPSGGALMRALCGADARRDPAAFAAFCAARPAGAQVRAPRQRRAGRLVAVDEVGQPAGRLHAARRRARC